MWPLPMMHWTSPYRDPPPLDMGPHSTVPPQPQPQPQPWPQIDVGHHCTGSPLPPSSLPGNPVWRPVHICSLEDPPVMTSGGHSRQVGSTHSTGMFSSVLYLRLPPSRRVVMLTTSKHFDSPSYVFFRWPWLFCIQSIQKRNNKQQKLMYYVISYPEVLYVFGVDSLKSVVVVPCRDCQSTVTSPKMPDFHLFPVHFNWLVQEKSGSLVVCFQIRQEIELTCLATCFALSQCLR